MTREMFLQSQKLSEKRRMAAPVTLAMTTRALTERPLSTGASLYPRVLLIDDDPLFRAYVQRVAEANDLNVTAVSSLREVTPAQIPKYYDVMIIDYFLDGFEENMRGTEVAAALESMPVLLISATDHCTCTWEAWASSIRKFLRKDVGPGAILKEAVGLIKRNGKRQEAT